MRKITYALSAAVAVPMAMAAPASAHLMVALTEGGDLIRFSNKNPNAVERVMITGTSARIVGIDTRPSNGELYGLASDGSIYRIDSSSGASTRVGSVSWNAADGRPTVVDFNPVADRLRIVSSAGRSLRVNVDTGEVIEDKRLAYATGDMRSGKAFDIAAGGYTNSMRGATTTQLYHIDGREMALVVQEPANDGTLMSKTPVTWTGTGTSDFGGMDIVTDAQGNHTGFIVAASRLYKVDLTTGQIALVGNVGQGDEFKLRDVAVIKIEW